MVAVQGHRSSNGDQGASRCLFPMDVIESLCDKIGQGGFPCVPISLLDTLKDQPRLRLLLNLSQECRILPPNTALRSA